MQFSLQQLSLATAAFLVSVYALVYATRFWAVAAYTSCVMLLLAAIVCAVAARGRPRYYWIGFATFGWGYWLVLHGPFLDPQPEPHNWQLRYEGPPLISRLASTWIYDNVLTR